MSDPIQNIKKIRILFEFLFCPSIIVIKKSHSIHSSHELVLNLHKNFDSDSKTKLSLKIQNLFIFAVLDRIGLFGNNNYYIDKVILYNAIKIFKKTLS